MAEQILVDGSALTCADVTAVAAGAAVLVDPAAVARAEASFHLVTELIGRREVYGRTTGVGALRIEQLDPASSTQQGQRLLRSHAGGIGDPLPAEHVRAMLLIRLNQLAAGRSGAHPRLVTALADALNSGSLPLIRSVGSVGTGDLTALAETALTLTGERPWASGGMPTVPIDTGDALAFMSSNAATLAQAVLAARELHHLLEASHVVAALSFVALDGSPEAYATPVHLARPHPGQIRCASEIRRLLGMIGVPKPGRRLQDTYGLRAFPQVQGPALDAVAHLHEILRVEINSSTENPMVSVEAQDVFHHAHFHTAYIAIALDQARAAVHHVAELSAARLSDLVEPEQSGLPAFLASGPPGSSGVMILEYVSHDALARLRQAALPVTLGTAVVSRGLEDHASFSTQAARQAATAAIAYRQVLAVELVAAVRALRMRQAELVDIPVRAAFDLADSALDPDLTDHSLTGDVQRAESLLDDFAAL